jgi:hypothetical protein
MNKKTTKFNFVSDEWVDQAEIILNDLVSQFGVEGVSFSVCETFSDAPKEIDASGVASWHFFIEGKSVRVGKGKVEDVDVKINFDYAKASVIAKVVYTEEIITKQKEETEKAKEALAIAGKEFKEPPDYLPKLHNRLALLTF